MVEKPIAGAYGSIALVNAGIAAQERCEILDQTPWSREFNWSQMEAISNHMGAYNVKAGDTIFREGEREAYLCLIAKGRIRILKRDSTNTNKMVTILGPGQTFGEMSLIDGEARSATAVAASDALLLILSTAEFSRLVAEAPLVAFHLLLKMTKLISRRLRMTTGMLVECFEE